MPTIPDALIEWRCDSWVPEDLKDDVPGADLPDGSAGSYVIGFDAQTGRLDQSNDEKGTVLVIGGKCEDIRSEIMRTFQRRTLLQRLTPWTE